jgi:RNA polymerase sigma factor for flagellar operon FliA
VQIGSELWVKYKDTKDIKIRDELLLSYLYIVKVIAKRMCDVYKNQAEIDDIISHGILILMDAIEKFDIDKGVKFETYASIRIRGSVIDYIRKQDWVPRGIRKKAKDLKNAFDELQSEHGNHVSDADIAEHMGISVTDVEKILTQSQGFNILSYEELLSESQSFEEPESKEDTLPDECFGKTELKEVIARSIDNLTEREKQVISLYYYEDLNVKEIAEVLELSDARVCQIHSRALMKMRPQLEHYIKG